MHDLAFTVDDEGHLRFVYHPNDEVTAEVIRTISLVESDQRAGHVWPKAPLARALFKLVRKVFGSKGPASDWTRSWNCEWVVVDAATMEQLPGVHPSHDAAVEAEVRWSLAHGYPKEVIGGDSSRPDSL